MKARWLILILAIVFLAGLAFVACGDDDDDDDDDTDDYDDDDESGQDIWTDPDTGLMWQNVSDLQKPDYDWEASNNYCQDLDLGGYTDWRLPTISELRSLVRGCEATETNGSCFITDECLSWSCWEDLCGGCSENTAPDNGCFWPSELSGECHSFWSASKESDDPDMVWGIDFLTGRIWGDFDYLTGGSVRCVRGDYDGDDDHTDDDDSENEVWTDSSSNLMWQKTGDCCYDWEEATSYCQNLNLDDYNDWRVPTISELRTLIRGSERTETDGTCEVTDACLDYDCWNTDCYNAGYTGDGPANGCYWPSELDGICSYYWSSSAMPPEEDLGDCSWAVDFSEAAVDFGGTFNTNNVRCVRDSESGDDDN